MKKLLIILLLAVPMLAFGQLDTVNIGSSANSGTGESLRAAFIKTNRHIKAYNAAYLYRLSLSGAHTVALTTTGNTALTLPTTGTLATTANLVSPAMTAPTVATTITPDASDGATLGTADVPWSDLFLAEGAVINFNASEITLTGNSSAGLLTIGGATFLDLASGILAGSTEIDDTELAALDGVTGSLNYSTENYGATGTGDVVFNSGPLITDPVITNAPRSTGTVVAGTGITSAMLSRFIYFNTASAIDITSDPQIANGTSGQIITIIGSSDTNTLTLDDSTGLRLTGQMVLGIGDNITLMYEGTIGDWIELSRAAN